MAILMLSLLLNLWGIHWGLPNRWNADEVTQRAKEMVVDRSLNPHFFAYGALHYYQVMALAVLPVKIFKKTLNVFDKTVFDKTAEDNAIVLLSRTLSALLGTGVVLLIYLLAKELFEDKTALLSSLMLAVSMGFVNISHFATTDIPSLFWFTAACLMASYVLTDESRRWYLLSGFFVGLAAAVKYIGGVALIALIAAHFLGGRRNHKALVMAIFTAFIGFIVSNPAIIFSFFEFAVGFLKENSFNSARNTSRPFAFFPMILQLRNVLGVPLFLLCIGGVLYSFKLLASDQYRPKVMLIFSMIIPYYLLIGSMHVSVLRYVVPAVPFLLVLAGKMVGDFISLKSRAGRIASIVLFGIIIGYSTTYTIAADLEFTNDSRYLAYQWIVQNVKEGSTIETTSFYSPRIPSDKYIVIVRPHNSMVDEPASLVQSNSTFLLLQKMISNLESAAERFKLHKRGKPYVAWWENSMDRYRSHAANFDQSLKGLEARKPDYLIVSTYYFGRFSPGRISFDRFSKDRYSTEGEFYDALLSGKTSYKKAAEFEYRFLPWINPQVEFVNPRIYVYRANAAPDNNYEGVVKKEN